MEMGWITSQLVVAVVVVVLVVGGLAFFALSGPRRPGTTSADGPGGAVPGAPDAAAGATTGGAGAVPGTAADAADPAAGVGVTGIPVPGADPGADVASRGAGSGADPGADVASRASVFETEPCWQSLLRGGRRPAGSGHDAVGSPPIAPVPDDAPAAGRA